MANRNTLFINETYIKTFTNVDSNVDAKYIGNCIWEAQVLNLIEIIGSGLYDELETQIDANTLTALNTTLLNKYIAPCLKYFTLTYLIPQAAYKITNKNIVSKNSENSTSVGKTDLDLMIEDATNKAQMMAKRLKDYLVENSDSYPLYDNPGSTIDTIHPNNDVFDSGIYTGNSRYKSNVPFGYRMDNPATYGCEDDE